MDSSEKYSETLKANFNDLVKSTEKYGIEFFKKGIKAGVEMTHLTNSINDIAFERLRTKPIALEWLKEQSKLFNEL